MDPLAIAVVALTSGVLAGSGIAVCAFLVILSAARQQSTAQFNATTLQALLWGVGSGGVVFGGGYLTHLVASFSDTPQVSGLVLLGYLGGFGGTIVVYRLCSRLEKSPFGRLSACLTGHELDAVMVMIRYNADDANEAARMLGTDPATLMKRYRSAMSKLQRLPDDALVGPGRRIGDGQPLPSVGESDDERFDTPPGPLKTRS